VRIKAKRQALDAQAVGVKAASYVTKPPEAAILYLQADEKNGGDDGTRTRGLCRDSEIFTRN